MSISIHHPQSRRHMRVVALTGALVVMLALTLVSMRFDVRAPTTGSATVELERPVLNPAADYAKNGPASGGAFLVTPSPTVPNPGTDYAVNGPSN